jgi:hypothetical protein
MRALLVSGLLLASVACKPSEGEGDFAGGQFQFTTTAVSDACFDGGLEAVFLPGGAGSTNDFANTIYVAGDDELPWTGEIALPDPFSAVEVTVTGDATSRSFAGADNTGVELDADAYPGCMVDMSIGVDLAIDSADAVSGTATLTTSSFDEENCPAVTAEPCDITLTLTGARAE